MMGEAILQVEDLHVVFPTPKGTVHAVGGVSFEVKKGQIYGIVGESGCGKSATGRAILRLVPSPGRIDGGRILFHGEDLAEKSESEMRQLRGRAISMIFQDPSAALNPLFTIGQQLMAIMQRHRVVSPGRMEGRAVELLGELGLPNPEELLGCYPHQLSGGMKQRAMIGMALSTEPDLIIADEPTSALDVTIQSQILDLLVQLQRERDVAVILITHDLGVVAETCDQVAVFYRGQIVEEGDARGIFRDPKHPYTQGLLAALPTASRWGDALKVIPGTVPTNLNPIVGCPFTSRCEHEMTVCQHINPPAIAFGSSHQVRCHLYGEHGNGGDR
jgi:oligopeptide/dipeptide ABC transporter ATP-binding protein